MTSLFNSDAARTILALCGALLLTTTFVGAAIAPAQAGISVTGVAR